MKQYIDFEQVQGAEELIRRAEKHQLKGYIIDLPTLKRLLKDMELEAFENINQLMEQC